MDFSVGEILPLGEVINGQAKSFHSSACPISLPVSLIGLDPFSALPERLT
jgi:hypothetical protein